MCDEESTSVEHAPPKRPVERNKKQKHKELSGAFGYYSLF